MLKSGEKAYPNIIYILADDMGYGDISALNENCPFKTINIDSMCREGMRFTDAHATASVCTPSRYGILTGRYNWRSRLKSSVTGGYSEPILEKGRKTVADMLKEQGYRTAMVGKWHLGMDFQKNKDFVENPDFGACDGVDYKGKITDGPILHGFDYFFGISGSLDMPPYVYIENDHFIEEPIRETLGFGKKYWRKGLAGATFKHENVLDELEKKVCEKIEEYKDAPFFIYFPMPAPHTPILPSKEFQGKSGTNEYGDFVLHCDDVVGRIIRKLRSEGVYDNTIVIYTSDNGCSPMADFDELQKYGHNPSYIFRGAKADIYEGGHRIPLIIQWPGRIRKDSVSKSIVCLSDFTATMADILGIDLPCNMAEDSVSNKRIWLEDPDIEVRKDIVHQSIDGSLSIRRGSFKLELCPGSGGWSDPEPGRELTGPKFQLYDLSEDIGERHNVIEKYPELAMELKRVLKNYVMDGRSTQGEKQANNGARIWDTVSWLDDGDNIAL